MIHRDTDDACIRKAATHGGFFKKAWLILRLVYWPGDPQRCCWHLHQKSHDTLLIRQKDLTYLKTSILTWWSTEMLLTLASEKPRHTADSSKRLYNLKTSILTWWFTEMLTTLASESCDTGLILQKDVTFLKTSILTWWSTEMLTTLASEKPRHTADSSKRYDLA